MLKIIFYFCAKVGLLQNQFILTQIFYVAVLLPYLNEGEFHEV